jgi:GT2 family glycosyltransferase
MNKIAIIYTTFLRDELMIDTINSIRANLPKNSILLIGDQNATYEKGLRYSSTSYPFTYYYPLPYDCGLSYARNYLIQRAQEMQIPYILVTADSIKFTQPYDFQSVINFIETDKSIAKIGLKLNKRIPWEFNLDLIPNKYFKLSVSNIYDIYNQIPFHKVDICRNFFLGRTNSFIQIPYDNNLKLFEHEDHCWRLKEATYKTYVTDSISADYIQYENLEYKAMRSRMYHEFKTLLLKKYCINSWIHYDFEVRKEINNWKEKNHCL